MPLYIKDDETTNLVITLAALRGVSKKEAVQLAVAAELDGAAKSVPLAERLERFWSENPPPPPTGLKADKAFFDELWGES